MVAAASSAMRTSVVREWPGTYGLPMSRDALMGAHGQTRHGQRHELGAVALGDIREMRLESHRWRGRGPQPQRVGGLPFILANEDAVGAGRFVPVDALGRIAEAIGAVLPETFAGPGALAAVDAENHRRGDALGLDQQGRQRARCLLGAIRELKSAALPTLNRSGDHALEPVDDAVDRVAVGAGREVQGHAVAEHRDQQAPRHHRSTATGGRAAGRGRGRRASAPGWRAGWPPGDVLVDELIGLGAGAGGAHDFEDGLGHLLAHRDQAGQALGVAADRSW